MVVSKSMYYGTKSQNIYINCRIGAFRFRRSKTLQGEIRVRMGSDGGFDLVHSSAVLQISQYITCTRLSCSSLLPPFPTLKANKVSRNIAFVPQQKSRLN